MKKKKDGEILKLLKLGWKTRNIAGYLQVQKADVWRVQRENGMTRRENNFEEFYY